MIPGPAASSHFNTLLLPLFGIVLGGPYLASTARVSSSHFNEDALSIPSTAPQNRTLPEDGRTAYLQSILIYPPNNDTLQILTPPRRCLSYDGTEGVCSSLVDCVYAFHNVTQLEQSLCEQDMFEGSAGVCCPSTSLNYSTEASSLKRPTFYTPGATPIAMPDINQRDMAMAMQVGVQYVRDLSNMETALNRKGLIIQRGSQEAYHLAFFGTFDQNMTHVGMVGLQASHYLAKAYKLSHLQMQEGLPRLNIKNSGQESQWCPRIRSCRPSKYRSPDGSCNNLEFPWWGRSFTALQRFLPPHYADGLSSARVAQDGGPLPSAREVSVIAVPDADRPDRRYNLILMQWAQFVDHDLTLTTLTRTHRGDGILCCHEEILLNPRLQHPACMPIAIPATDPFYSPYGQRCMEFVRSLPAPRPNCSFGPREQMNQLTSFLDGSNVYGSTEKLAKALRSFEGGKLKVHHIDDKEMLPLETNLNEECSLTQNTHKFFCFRGGDDRVNEQLNLAAMHTVWMREHNRVAKLLAMLNPRWDDELLYQEARRIVIAELQHITFNEFLPIILGRNTMDKFELTLTQEGFSESYDPSVNPTVANVFAAAAYRFGHTLVQGRSPMMNKRGEIVGAVPLQKQFFNPVMLTEGQTLDHLLLGLINRPPQRYDRFITAQLTNHLFQQKEQKFGMDLVALNIQRARDHGIPGYNQWRVFCHLPRIRTFQELANIMHPDSARAFRYLYRHVDDIDLFPAGISEYPLPNATLGPTFACLVAEQFRRLKVGDRHWYENGGLLPSFSLAQLREFRKASLARVLCDNVEEIERIRPWVFRARSSHNRRISCRHRRIPHVSLDPWKATTEF